VSLLYFRMILGRCIAILSITPTILLVWSFTKMKPCGFCLLTRLVPPLDLELKLIAPLPSLQVFPPTLSCPPLLFFEPLLGGAFRSKLEERLRITSVFSWCVGGGDYFKLAPLPSGCTMSDGHPIYY
jgi:hypothetical protein